MSNVYPSDMALLGGFLKQMNDTLADNRRLNKKFTVEKLRETYRVGVVWMLMVITSFAPVYAQIPQDIPNQSEPADFTSPLNIVLYIILPLLMVIGYYFWRKSKRNQ